MSHKKEARRILVKKVELSCTCMAHCAHKDVTLSPVPTVFEPYVERKSSGFCTRIKKNVLLKNWILKLEIASYPGSKPIALISLCSSADTVQVDMFLCFA